MKQLILLVLLIMSASLVAADVMIPGMKNIPYCTTVTNADSLEEYYVIGAIEGVSTFGYKLIHDNECFETGYKFNTGHYYFMNKTDYDLLDQRTAGSEAQLPVYDYTNLDIIYPGHESFFPVHEKLVKEGKLIKLPITTRSIMMVASTDPRESITQAYTLDPDDVMKITDNQTITFEPEIKTDWKTGSIIFWFIIPLIALILLIIEIRRRKVGV